ncbi:MAG: MarR family transcriptional regulator [Sulfuriferula sp.]|nr:MarR family transcriptional regulator [Sulfuriferula sp.]
MNAFEQRLDIIDQQISGQPRQEVMLSRMQFIIFKKLNELLNARLEAHGINDTMMTALMMLYSSPERYIFPSDLSHIVISSRTNITRFADEMVKKGWVSRKGHEIDRRKIILTLTDAGIAFVESVLPEQWQVYQALWQDFSAAEKNQLEAMQHKLLAAISGLSGLPEPLLSCDVSLHDVKFKS